MGSGQVASFGTAEEKTLGKRKNKPTNQPTNQPTKQTNKQTSENTSIVLYHEMHQSPLNNDFGDSGVQLPMVIPRSV